MDLVAQVCALLVLASLMLLAGRRWSSRSGRSLR
jgi:hypothetical protein